jgi:hypothetical protein
VHQQVKLESYASFPVAVVWTDFAIATFVSSCACVFSAPLHVCSWLREREENREALDSTITKLTIAIVVDGVAPVSPLPFCFLPNHSCQRLASSLKVGQRQGKDTAGI